MEKHETASPHAPSENFKFKYVAEEELLRIVRKVRREKQKEKDALMWKRFVEDRQKNAFSEAQHDKVDELCPVPSSSCCCIENEEMKDSVKPFTQADSFLESIPSEIEVAHLPLKRLLPTDGGVTARETVTIQRIALLHHRIGLALDSITGMIQCSPAEPDGPDDLERRKTRLNEFLSRFSRNYLFQFQRQVAELRRHIVSASVETPGRHTEYQTLMQKLVSAHQTALQSLQAYLTQIPASLQVTNIFGKLKDLLHHLCDLSSLKSQLNIHAGIIDGCEDIEQTDEVYLKCRELLSLLEEKRSEPEGVSSPVSGRGSLNPKTQRVVLCASSGMHPSSWKKTSAYLARTRFGAPSSVRSSVSAHASSRGRHSHKQKMPKDAKTCSCCNSELKEIMTHMHDVLCNKVTAMNKKKSRHRKSAEDNSSISKKKLTSPPKPLNKVQNLSNNVQLVITQHYDSESDGYKDAATDTADLNDEGDSKKPKRVVWATRSKSLSKDADLNNKSSLSSCQQQRNNLPHYGDDAVARQRNAPQQHIFNYRQRFHDYNAKAQNPSIQRWCQEILDGVFKEISEELEPSFLLEKMYRLEFQDT